MGAGSNHQLLFRAGDYSIDLQIASFEQRGAELIGQVLKEGEPSFESVSALKIELVREQKPVLSTVTDEMGEFRVSGVEHGRYDLRIELSEGSITVPDLPLVES